MEGDTLAFGLVPWDYTCPDDIHHLHDRSCRTLSDTDPCWVVQIASVHQDSFLEINRIFRTDLVELAIVDPDDREVHTKRSHDQYDRIIGCIPLNHFDDTSRLDVALFEVDNTHHRHDMADPFIS